MKLATPDDTLAWGRALAPSLGAGDVIALVGHLGAGKTQAAKGIAAGLGSITEGSSPTFTLVHEYGGGRLPVFHFDFYRLDSPQEVLGIGWDEYLEAGGVTIVEWADKFPQIMPAAARWFRFAVESDAARRVEEWSGPNVAGPLDH